MTTRSEVHEILAALRTPLGQPGSGRVRYAAAMYLNRAGRLSDSNLELFRVCSARDGEDPSELAAQLGLEMEFTQVMKTSQEIALARLVGEADRYFARLKGIGVNEVRAGLAKWRDVPCAPVVPKPNDVVDRWMARALNQVRPSHPSLAEAIEMVNPYLQWMTFDGYSIEEIGADFPANHAYAPLFGDVDAPYTTVDWHMCLFLIAPHVLYRDHRHVAPELYATLTGPHGWRFGPDDPVHVLPADVPVWNESMRPHMTKVGPEPFLCLVAWTKDINEPAWIVPAADWAELETLRLEA